MNAKVASDGYRIDFRLNLESNWTLGETLLADIFHTFTASYDGPVKVIGETVGGIYYEIHPSEG